MKKSLPGTTALVAVTAAAVTAGAAKADMSVTGWSTFGVGAGNVKTRGRDGPDPSNGDFDIYENGEIYFNGTTEMDNGVSLSWDVQLETENDNGNFIDENYFTISGDFGSIVIGQENLPNYKMHYTGGLWVGSAGLSSGSYTQFTGSPGNISYTHDGFMNDRAPIGDDADMISWYTPRISGFQLGVGYMPDDDPNDNVKTDITSLEDNEYEHTVSVGANYTADISGASVAVSTGYTLSDVNDINEEKGPDQSDGTDTDLETWQFGLNIGAGGLTLGASYMAQTDDKRVRVNGADTENYMVGASYAIGPHTAGISAVFAEYEKTGYNKKARAVMLAHDYALGGGVSVTSSIVFLDFDDKEVVAESADGQAAMVYLNAGF